MARCCGTCHFRCAVRRAAPPAEDSCGGATICCSNVDAFGVAGCSAGTSTVSSLSSCSATSASSAASPMLSYARKGARGGGRRARARARGRRMAELRNSFPTCGRPAQVSRTCREKLPRSKEKFRLESDSGKRDGCSPTSPFSVAAGSLNLQRHPCEAVTRWMSIHLHKVCCCSHSCAESITVTHSR